MQQEGEKVVQTMQNSVFLSLSHDTILQETFYLCKNFTTLQQHQAFWTKMAISVISDLLKSVGGTLLGFFPWKYLRHLSIHLANYYIVCSGILYQIMFKSKYAGNQRTLTFCVITPFLSISNFWQLQTNCFKPVQTRFINQLFLTLQMLLLQSQLKSVIFGTLSEISEAS